jgi:NADPH-dependent glutamate synthase beta subunit-like oxidoreductase
MDIPTMLRQIAAGQLKAAIETIKKDIPLPAILGRICPAPCEKVCRRSGADGAVSICLLKRFAADADLASATAYQPELKALTGCKAAIVGAGPAGLSAAYYLRQGGIACDLYDEHAQPGGALRYAEIDRDVLPLETVEREVDVLLAAGIKFQGNFRLGRDVSLDELTTRYDAVVLALGPATEQVVPWNIDTRDGKIKIVSPDYSVIIGGTVSRNVFAVGACIGSRRLCVRAAADGKEAARAVLRRLGFLANSPAKPYNQRLGKLEKGELDDFLKRSSSSPRLEPQSLRAGYDMAQAAGQALRCLDCDCSKKEACGLRELAGEFGARQKTYAGQVSSSLCQDGGAILYDSGKCIKCGLCVQTAQRDGAKPGFAFEGRGFEMKIAVPLAKPLSGELLQCAEKYAAVCPTGALALRRGMQQEQTRP